MPDPSRPSSPPLFQPSARSPPSSFVFPFQAYPGNPDPLPFSQRRRSSLDSLSPPDFFLPPPSSAFTLRRRSASMSDDLPPPNAPFMSATASSPSPSPNPSLHHSPSSNSLYKASAAFSAAASLPRNTSTHSFRSPFLSPASRPSSWMPPASASSATALALAYGFRKGRPPGPSTRLTEPPLKPWLHTHQPGVRTSYLLTLLFIFLGLLGAAALCFFGYSSVQILPDSKLCLVMDDSFSQSGLNSDHWNIEVQSSGFGNGEFQLTSSSSQNLFIKNNQLYLYPTLTSTTLNLDIFDGSNYTLPDCTVGEAFSSYIGPNSPNSLVGVAAGPGRAPCSAASSRLLSTVIPPAISARINTKGKKSIKYGKVEVRAKLPRGDWLWPAVWMLPEESAYGAWPLSGEIDILESRGNPASYPAQGSNYVRSSLNYGPLPSLFTQIYGWQRKKQRGFERDFHTYTLEWTPDFIRMSVDSKLIAMLEVSGLRTKKKSFWYRAKYPQVASNWTADHTGSGELVVVKNVWEEAGGGRDAPFDRPFYLIINLAVGGTSGWFPDSKGSKPWLDASQTAMRDFAAAQGVWAATWPESVDERSFRIDSVKMWEMCRA